MSLTEAQAKRKNAILKDLIQKRPTENGCIYEEDSYFDHDRNYRRKRMVPSKPFFGYDPSELYELQFGESGWALRSELSELFDKAITQKINRIDERITQPLNVLIREEGIPGLYSVATSKSQLGYIHAADLDEARRVADIAYGFVIAGQTDRWGDPLKLGVRFRSQGTVADLNQNNQRDIDRIKKRIQDAKEEIEKTKLRIAEYENDLVAIQMSEMSQLTTSFEEDAA